MAEEPPGGRRPDLARFSMSETARPAMPVKIHCPNPNCDASYSVLDENLGRLGRCKKCGTKFPLVPPTKGDVPPSSESDLGGGQKSSESVLASPFGHYEIIRLLGRGGMGAVYLAFDTMLERRVALKVPHREYVQHRGMRERFLREGRAAARFHHPNFCPIYEIGEIHGQPYLTMAYIEGGTLGSRIERGKPWDQPRAAETVRTLALALAEAHRDGIVHRDLKPANIMVNDRGRLVIMDFGLARRFEAEDSTLTGPGVVLGTASYMSPEQAEGQSARVGPRSDLYSLGVILYELIAGRRPFLGSAQMVLAQLLTTDPAPPSAYHAGVHPVLESICLKAIAREIEDRYPSMDDFVGALDAFLKAPTVPIPPKPDDPPITNTIGMKLKLIPAGEFLMGAPDREPEALEDERPQHRVRITRPFYLGVYEVTQAEYREVMGNNPSHFSAQGGGRAEVAGLDTSRHPVENVSWRDAIAFCNKLSEREGLGPCYGPDGGRIESGDGYRLPTEAEWEYACRAGTTTAFAFGPSLSTATANFDGSAVYNGSSKGASLRRTTPVGGYSPNRFGLHDMHGNVWEWCGDFYDDKYYKKSPENDPPGPPEAADRVIRGGGWYGFPRNCRSAYRFRYSPGYRINFLGFRVARVRSGP
jgi:formylglycine-generating enzyme required for sulfatase activity/predicted Ser/Thr protein kinase